MATKGQLVQQKTRFLDTFRVTGNVLRSCQSAGVPRTNVYRWLERDEKFSLAYHQAERDAEDVLERAAWDRATRGRTKRVYWQGKLVEETQEPSDLLLMFLLKARNPQKYRDRVTIDYGSIPTDQLIAEARALGLVPAGDSAPDE